MRLTCCIFFMFFCVGVSNASERIIFRIKGGNIDASVFVNGSLFKEVVVRESGGMSGLLTGHLVKGDNDISISGTRIDSSKKGYFSIEVELLNVEDRKRISLLDTGVIQVSSKAAANSLGNWSLLVKNEQPSIMRYFARSILMSEEDERKVLLLAKDYLKAFRLGDVEEILRLNKNKYEDLSRVTGRSAEQVVSDSRWNLERLFQRGSFIETIDVESLKIIVEPNGKSVRVTRENGGALVRMSSGETEFVADFRASRSKDFGWIIVY